MNDTERKINADTDVDHSIDPESMDPTEAAIVAKVLAKMMVEAESQSAAPRISEEDLLAAEAAEQAAKRTLKGKFSSVGRRIVSVLSPDNKRWTLPAITAEFLVLVALVLVLGKYSHVAPDTPTNYSDPRAADSVSCQDGLLIVNGVSARVPVEENVNYSISYTWASDDQDYPSVPHAIVASYMDSSGENALYDISLYKDSYIERSSIPPELNQSNWFDEWTTEKNEDVYQFPYKVGQISGFCISTMDSASAVAGYRTYTYYFAVPENSGISVYVLEGVCYDITVKELFTETIKNAIKSIEIGQTDI